MVKTYSFWVDSVHNRYTPYERRLRKRKQVHIAKGKTEGAKPHRCPESGPRWKLNSKRHTPKGIWWLSQLKTTHSSTSFRPSRSMCPQGQQARSFLGATRLVGGEGKLAATTQHLLPAAAPVSPHFTASMWVSYPSPNRSFGMTVGDQIPTSSSEV